MFCVAARARQLVLLQAIDQRTTRHPEELRRHRLVAMAPLESVHDSFSFERLELRAQRGALAVNRRLGALALLRRGRLNLGDREAQMSRFDRPPLGNDQRTVERVLELANVSGPC